MEAEEIGAKLKDSAKMAEVWHEVERFECYRETGRGGANKVIVQIMNQVAINGRPRYMVHAESENGKHAAGNPAPTIEEALLGVHWWDLDRD